MQVSSQRNKIYDEPMIWIINSKIQIAYFIGIVSIENVHR